MAYRARERGPGVDFTKEEMGKSKGTGPGEVGYTVVRNAAFVADERDR